MLHQYEPVYYGGKVRIIPLSLKDFQNMLKQAYYHEHKPTASTIKDFVQKASELAINANNEVEWYEGIQSLIIDWI